MRKEKLATYHNFNYSINYYSLTKGGGGVPAPQGHPPGSTPVYRLFQAMAAVATKFRILYFMILVEQFASL